MVITRKSFPVERLTIVDNIGTDKRSSRPCNSESIVTVVITKRTCKGKSYKQDSAWAWLIAVCALVSNILVLGNVFSFGVLNPVLLEEFQQGKARTAWIGSLCMAGTAFYGTVVGNLCDRLGTHVVAMVGALSFISGLLASSQVPSMWMLYLTYSGLVGFGTCCVHIASCLAVSRSFYRRRSFATGILLAGHSVGVLVVSPIWQLSLVNLGWRNSFLVMAGLSAPICILICIFKTDLVEELQVEKSIKKYRQNIHSQPFSIWKHPPFVVFTISSAFLNFGIYIPHVHMASYCKDLNIDGNDAARLYLGLGVASLVSKLLVGKICEVKMFSAERVYQAAGLMMAITNLLCPLAKSYAGVIVYFVVLGFTEGSVIVPIYYLVLNCVPDEARSKSIGFWMFTLSLSMAAGPPFAGFLADELGSYVPTFYMAGGIIIISPIVVFFLACFKKDEAILTNEDNSDTELIVEKITVL